MRVRYIYSACVVIETDDARILCDPWFTQGTYDGAWFQYPRLADPVAAIGPVDLVYISHIHPDHYDAAFLRQYRAAYPEARLVIAKQRVPHLANKMRVDGFKPEIVEGLSMGGTELLIVPHDDPCDPKSGIDSALAVRASGRSVVNMNDNPFLAPQLAALRAFCPGGRPDFALLPYSGAGPWPQTFVFDDLAELVVAAEDKKRKFLALFARYLDALEPVRAMPFAGKYWLGGPLARLNPYRGIPDPVEVKARHGDRIVVLADGGEAFYDLSTGRASAERLLPYDLSEVDRYLRRLEFRGYDYERELVPLSGHALPIAPLLAAAKRRAREKVAVGDPFWVVFRPTAEASYVLNIADDAPPAIHGREQAFDTLQPRLEISIDQRYLFGLLTRLYHWNNAEIGSQYASRRVPETYRPEVYAFLNMLQV